MKICCHSTARITLCVLALLAFTRDLLGSEEKVDPALAKQLHILRHGKGEERDTAAKVIRDDFGPRALPILPQLLEILGEEIASYDYKERAKTKDYFSPVNILLEAIVTIGDKGEFILLKAARYAQPKTRTAALRALGLWRHNQGPKVGRKSWPLIKKAMTDPSPLVRREGLYVGAGYFPEKYEETIPLLIEALKDNEPGAPNQETISVTAAQGIGSAAYRGYSALVKPAIPALLETAKLHSKEHPNWYFTVLGRIGWWDPSVRPQLYAVMMSFVKNRPDLRGEALAAILGFREGGKKDLKADLPFLITLMKDFEHESKHNRTILLRAFIHLGPDAAPAVPLIVGVLQNSKDEMERIEAVRALQFIGPAARVALPALEKAANSDPHYLVKRQARQLLSEWKREER